MKTIELPHIKMEYCENCFKYRVDHPPENVFHGINSEHLKKQGLVINPVPDVDRDFYKRYEEYFPKPGIRLGPLEICGFSNPNYDSYLAFDVETLKENNPDILFVNYDFWCSLAFYDLSEEEIRIEEEQLFVDDYTTDETIEVVVGKLDMNLVSFALSSSDRAYKVLQELRKKLRKDFEITRADDLVSIVRKGITCDVECDCGL